MLTSRLLCELNFRLFPPMAMPGEHDQPWGMPSPSGMSEGRITGHRISGTILPGGVDWMDISADGTGRANVRVMLRTEDGAHIAMTYNGVFYPMSDNRLMARLQQRGVVSSEEYYLRTAIQFTTNDSRYGWLNPMVAVGLGQLDAGDVRYRVYEIL